MVRASVLGVDGTGRLAVFSTADGRLLHAWQADTAAGAIDVASVLAWSGDGTRFAAATDAGRVFLGGPGSSTLASLDPHASTVWAVVFSPDGTRVATAGKDGVTMIRDAATGATLARLADGPAEIATLAWLDTTHVVAGDDHGRARIWDVAAQRLVRTLTQKGAIYGVLAADDWLVTFGDATEATVFDLATGAIRATLPGHSIAIDLAAIAGGHLVTSDESGNAFVWDPTSGERLQTIPNEGTLNGLTTDGARVVLSGNGRIRVWSAGVQDALQRTSGHTARVRDLAWSPDGRRLWSASHDGTARGFELATGKVTVLGTPDGFQEPAITALPAPASLPTNPRGLRSLRISPDGSRIVTAAEDGALVVWSSTDPKRSQPLIGHTGRVRRAVFSPDGTTLYSVGDHTLRAWDLRSGKERAVADVGASAWDVALVGTAVATQDEQKPNQVALWSATDLRRIPAPGLTTRFFELFSANDRLLVANDAEIDAIDPTGRRMAATGFTSGNSASVVGDLVAVGGIAGDIGLFEWPSLRAIRSWPGGGFIAASRFRPDGAILATAGDRRVRLWDPKAGRLLVERELPALISQLAWSPDGTQLAIAGGSGTVWIWNLPPADPARLATYNHCVSPWRLDDTAIVAAPFDPASCSVLGR